MLIYDSQGHIPEHIKQNKEYFREIKPFYCKECRETNTMLENVFVKGENVSFVLSCFECGSIDTINTNEKELYKQMVRYHFTEIDDVLQFALFQVAVTYAFFSNVDSELEAMAMMKRLTKKFRQRKWFNKLRFNKWND